MTAYPSTISILEPFPDVTIRFKTLKSQYDDLGQEQRRQKWLFPRRDLRIRHILSSLSDARTLWQFYMARNGSEEAFNFFFPSSRSDTYVGEYIGTGDGSETIFNCPSKDASSRTFYLDEVEETGLSFSAEGGTDSADEVTFNTAPASGVRITMDFTGQLKVRCTFLEDNLSFQQFLGLITDVGLVLRGELNQ